MVTSLYYYGINAALKAVIDRFYAYNHELHGGKQAVTLISGYGDDSAFASMKLYFKQLLDYMRWQPAGTVLASDSWNGRQLAKHVQEAAELGHQFEEWVPTTGRPLLATGLEWGPTLFGLNQLWKR